MTVHLVPILLRTARGFIASRGEGLRLGLVDPVALGVADEDGELVGAAVLARPIAPDLNDGWTLHLTRLSVNQDTPDAAALLYESATRAAEALGYCRVSTHPPAEQEDVLTRAGWRRSGPAGADFPKRWRWEFEIRPVPTKEADPDRGAILALWRTTGLTQRQIAAAVGRSKTHVARVVRGCPRLSGARAEVNQNERT